MGKRREAAASKQIVSGRLTKTIQTVRLRQSSCETAKCYSLRQIKMENKKNHRGRKERVELMEEI